MPDGTDGRQANGHSRGVSCDGSCTQRCGALTRYGLGPTPASAAADRRRPGLVGSTACSSFGVAHLHISRLIRAAGVVSPPPGCTHDSGATSSRGVSKAYRRRGKTPVHTPSPKRSDAAPAGFARQNPHLLGFLVQLLCYDPDERLTPLQALAHPFFGDALPFEVLQPTTTTVGDHRRKAPAAQSSEIAPTRSASANSAGRTEVTTPTRNQCANRRDQEIASSDARGALSMPSECLARKAASPISLLKSGMDGRTSSGCNVAVPRTGRRPNDAEDSSFETSGDISVPNALLKVPFDASGGSCSDVSVLPTPAEDRNPSVGVDHTAQLRRLAELAGAMVEKDKTQDSRCQAVSSRGWFKGSDASGTVTLPPRRHNRFLNAALLAKIKHEEELAEGGSRCRAMSSSVTTGRMAPSSNKRRNPFLTPATLAILKRNLGADQDVRSKPGIVGTVKSVVAAAEEGSDTAAEWLGVGPSRMESAATQISTPARKGNNLRGREKAKQSHEGKKHPASVTPKRDTTRRAAAGTEEQCEEQVGGLDEAVQRYDHREQRGAHIERCKRPRRSEISNWKRTTMSNNYESYASPRSPGGRTTTPRRAAIAAGEALLRLRDEEDSSDG